MQMIRGETARRSRGKSELVAILRERLPSVFLEGYLRDEIQRLLASYSGGTDSEASTRRRSALIRATSKVSLKWNKSAQFDLRTFLDQQAVDEYEVLFALMQKPTLYVSHMTAMYFLDILEQRPTDFLISIEVPGKSSGINSGKIDSFRMRQAFLKAPRITQNYFFFRKHKFSLIERLPLAMCGVTSKRVSVNNGEALIRHTDLERTFLDSLISPQYGGGVLTILKAYENVSLNFKVLRQYYNELNPIYPIWQRIGFILERLGKATESEIWADQFAAVPKQDFYLTHGARSTWKFSKRWNLHYPEGLDDTN